MVLAMRFVHNGAKLVERKSWDVIQDSVWTHKITPVGIYLDPVSAKADLLTHRFAAIFRPIHHLHAVRDGDLRRISQQRISARNIHGARGNFHSWTGNNSVVDGLLQIHVGITRAFGL